MACWRGCEAGVTGEAEVPADAAGQARLGYRFEPANARYDALYAVAREELDLAAHDANAWLALPPAAREPALRRAGLKSGAALLVLESAALRRQEALVRDELKRRWLRDARSIRAAGDIAGPLQDFLRLGGAFSRPASWLQDVPGYGLPQASEREVLAVRVRADAALRQAQAGLLESTVRRLLAPARRAALEGTEANVALIGGRLRELAAEPP